MKITESTLKEIIMEEIASLDLDEVKLAPALFNALKKMGKLPKGAVSDISQVGGQKGAAKGRTSAELGAAFAKAASKPTQIAKGTKESNPAATKFNVMKKLEKKVGKMAMKVIVAAMEKDPKLMTTLSMVLKEEAENTEVE